ncbi:MAG: hypothetical protein AAGC60_03580 [Acidobacteriota bacterium]
MTNHRLPHVGAWRIGTWLRRGLLPLVALVLVLLAVLALWVADSYELEITPSDRVERPMSDAHGA